MRKKLLAVMLTAAMVMGLTACAAAPAAAPAAEAPAAETEAAPAEEEAPAEEAAPADGEKIIINFYEHSDNDKTAARQVEEFNKLHPEYEVRLSLIANDDYDDKIKVMLAGDADIDVLWVRSGNIRQMGVDGAIMDIAPLIKERGIDYSKYGAVGETCVDGDAIYGLCTTKSCWLLWYNKDLFDAAGVELPYDITWDEYADLCQQLTTDELRGGLTVNWTYLIGAQAHGEYLCDEDLTYTRRYSEFLHRIWTEDESNYTLEEMSGSFDVNGTFAEGNTYMMINGDWNFNLFPNSNPEFEWGALPLPHYEDQEVNSSMGSTSAYCINAKSDNVEAAMDFIQFCCYSDEGAKLYAENAGVAVYPSEEAMEVYQENCKIPGTEYVFAANCNLEDGPEARYSEIKDAWSAEVQEYLLDNETLDECFENFYAKREEILAK